MAFTQGFIFMSCFIQSWEIFALLLKTRITFPSVGKSPPPCSNYVLGWVSSLSSPTSCSCKKCEHPAQVLFGVRWEPPPGSPSNIFLVTLFTFWYLPLRMLNNEIGFTLEWRPGPGVRIFGVYLLLRGLRDASISDSVTSDPVLSFTVTFLIGAGHLLP